MKKDSVRSDKKKNFFLRNLGIIKKLESENRIRNQQFSQPDISQDTSIKTMRKSVRIRLAPEIVGIIFLIRYLKT